MSNTPSARSVAGTLGGVLLLAGIAGVAQEDHPTPSFATETAVITVDVVVRDGKGRPVHDLAPADFTVLEDGKAQAVVSFQERDLLARRAEVVPPQGRVATNVGGRSDAGRALAFVLDDLGLDPVLGGAYAQKAVARWLEEQADPRDDVTIATTSGDAWWSDTVGRGKADLLAVLKRARGKKQPREVREYLSDWEASEIVSGGGLGGAASHTGAKAASRGADFPPPSFSMGPPDRIKVELGGVLERVVKRWQRQGGACDGMTPQMCEMIVHRRSEEVHDRTLRRRTALLRLVERLSRALADRPGRKSIVLFSESFIELPHVGPDEKALDAARRANVAVYFIDARGLAGPSFFSAQNPSAPDKSDVGFSTFDLAFSMAGGESLAEATGGFAVQSNDLFDGVRRAADESSTYYLLGYQPTGEPDGKWHRINVTVDRPGVRVRARAGYYGTKSPFPLREETGAGTTQVSSPLVDPALLAGGDREAIPLRLTCRTVGTSPEGQRLLIGLDIRARSLAFEGGRATVDVTLLGVSRQKPVLAPDQQRVTLRGGGADDPEWWAYTREIVIPAGVAQVKALVRDVATGRSGTVTQRVEIAEHLSEVPRDFEQEVATLLFNPEEGKRKGMLLVHLPAHEARATGVSDGRLVLVARIDDASGRTVERLTHQWSGAEEAGLRRFRGPLALPPGDYTLESSVLDLESGGLSVERRGIHVPVLGGVALSSLVLLGGGAPATDDAPSGADPLNAGGVTFVPRLDTRLAQGTPELPLLFRVYPSGGPPVQLSLEVQREGQRLVDLEPQPPAPDAGGSLPWLGSLPLAALPPGHYRIVVQAHQGAASAEETLPFEVVAAPIAGPTGRGASAQASPPQTDDPALARALGLAGRYLMEYAGAFRNLVAEEVYDQFSPGRSQQRRTRADIVFVTLKGAFPWGCFRDVYEVDGHAVREREARLEELFQKEGASAAEKARAIRNESARYNIEVPRTVNEPTAPLMFLLPANQRRSVFRVEGHERVSDVDGLVVSFEEKARPTMISDNWGGDLPAFGRFWISAEGVVLKSEIRLGDRYDWKASIVVEYRSEPSLSIWVPAVMSEWYGPVQARARYSSYRRFSVDTSEAVIGTK